MYDLRIVTTLFWGGGGGGGLARVERQRSKLLYKHSGAEIVAGVEMLFLSSSRRVHYLRFCCMAF